MTSYDQRHHDDDHHHQTSKQATYMGTSISDGCSNNHSLLENEPLD